MTAWPIISSRNCGLSGTLSLAGRPVRVAQRSGDVAAQVVADTAGVPPGRSEQPLHPVRARLPGMLGQRPAGLTFQPGRHPAQASASADPDFPAEEPARDQRERVIKPGSQP